MIFHSILVALAVAQIIVSAVGIVYAILALVQTAESVIIAAEHGHDWKKLLLAKGSRSSAQYILVAQALMVCVGLLRTIHPPSYVVFPLLLLAISTVLMLAARARYRLWERLLNSGNGANAIS